MTMSRQNLFLTTRRLTTAHEDHLTEFFASALATNATFAKSYIDLLLASRDATWGPQTIIDVETQGSGYQHGTPDMVLRLEDAVGTRRTIAVEHKIEAAQTVSLRGRSVGDVDAGDPVEPIRQLAWYLDLPGIDAVAYVRQSFRPPDRAVLDHPNYVRPASGEPHFTWDHFQPLLERHKDSSVIVAWLADAFRHFGYGPANLEIGDLKSPDPEVRDRARQNLQKLWMPMRQRAEALGWKTESGSIHEVYFTPPPTNLVKSIWLNPLHQGTRLVVRFTPRDGSPPEALYDALAVTLPTLLARVPMTVLPDLAVGTQRRQGGPETVVQVTSSLSDIVGDIRDRAEIERRLATVALTLIEAMPSGDRKEKIALTGG